MSPAATQPRPAVPGDVLLTWPAVVALVALLLNDHVLKPALASWWTGKVSGIAAFVVVPFLVVAVWEVVRRRTLSPRDRYRLVLVVGVAIATAMAGAELLPSVSRLYEVVFGTLRWPLDTAMALVAGDGLPSWSPVVQTMDATDLVTLPAALVPAWSLTRTRP